MGKPDTKSKPKPKRDPNQPLPKRPKGRLKKLLALGLVLIAGAVVGGYSLHSGRPPWEWQQEDVQGIADYTQAQVKDAVASVDWEALKGKITEQTRRLYEGVPQLEQKLDATLARLRGQPQGGEPAKSGETGKAEAATPGQPAVSVPPRTPTTYEQGCETLREAIQVYKRSFPGGKGDKRSDKELQKELKAAKELFRRAYDQLGKAHEEAEQRGDAKEAEEIEGVLMQANTYLEDCSKRETL